ncbi:hypothetical protein A4U61_12535 [Streptomyces sp. H-KF8]|uniref:hypothetical protein n=1 Tax=Streptomyces sp. H-KF8 TaxID=1727216 RepID=UPI0007EE2680|nr:hypothetical protein [Streptomyces sp. H-KF8]OBQ50955.1 hypothetical protein A4U61_12535 [Streptomyces sp. H-KF8]
MVTGRHVDPRTGRVTFEELLLGHASGLSTLRIYAHLWPGEEDRTRTVMDTVLGGLRTGCGQVDQAIEETAGQSA